jgi:hypothetical protein
VVVVGGTVVVVSGAFVVVVDLSVVVVVCFTVVVVDLTVPTGLDVTTSDHLPHVSLTLPRTCPGAVSRTNRYSALPK